MAAASQAPALPDSALFRRRLGTGQQAVLTICACNYIAQAKVLAATLTEHHPEIDLYVVVVDERDAAFAAEHASLNLVWAEDLGVPDFAACTARFDVIELSTNIKPHTLARLLDQYDRVLYLDPDIAVYHRLDEVFAALHTAPIVLTPASMTPVRDGHQPDDIEWLRVGAFNLGFIGVARHPVGLAFLQWWSSRCLSDGFHDTPAGVFLDQKWIDLVPAFFPAAHVLRDPGLNMASWNLHERRLEFDGHVYSVNGLSPLKFFHFSSFDPAQPQLVARRQTRFRSGERSDLTALLDRYAQRLIEAGHTQASQRPYSYDRFRSGEYLSPTLRRMYANPAHGFPLDEDPRAAGSALHRFGRAKGLISHDMAPAGRASAGDAGKFKREAVWLNRLFRLALRLLGPNRYFLLMRYLAHAASIRRQPPL